VLSAPVIAVAAVAIRAESRGHWIYRQRRVGKDGHAFDVYKLRTMVSGAEHMGAGMAVDEGDTRITRVGALLRRTSIDELPNLLNVLRGEMSVVGPRPTIQVQVDQYTERQLRRLTVRPGLTGWAQVNGRASLPWSTRRCGSTCGSSGCPRAWPSPATGSTAARPAAGAADPALDYWTTSGP
jgi:lipopolysaccharide/colanic/teichoic acid biosynthesis glycosyltransferase